MNSGGKLWEAGVDAKLHTSVKLVLKAIRWNAEDEV